MKLDSELKPGGIVGQKYQIKYKGRLYGYVKKINPYLYKITSKPGEKIFSKYDKDWRDKYVKYAVRKAINLSSELEMEVNNNLIVKGPIQFAKFTTYK